MSGFVFEKCEIDGLIIITPKIYADTRGHFFESYNARAFEEAGYPWRFVQDNESLSVRGVLRGLHRQMNYPQGKLVRVVAGTVFDVAVDLRPDSPTYMKWHAEYLSGENHRQMYIPEGFAHGFYTLSDTAVFAYRCTDYYHPDDERGIAWNDESFAIHWPLDGKEPILSAKDGKNPRYV